MFIFQIWNTMWIEKSLTYIVISAQFLNMLSLKALSDIQAEKISKQKDQSGISIIQMRQSDWSCEFVVVKSKLAMT